MRCPACTSRATSERSERTELGYHRFRCQDCGRGFNERSGTVFNRLQYPRKVRRGKVGKSWYTDETYLRVAGRWCYLCRAIDRAANLVDVRTSESRDRAAAEAFFASAQAVTRIMPQRVTTDGHDVYPGAIKAKLGDVVTHRTSRYLNNHLEQDHRGIKGRSQPMRGFKSVTATQRFYRAYDEVRHFLRHPSPRGRRFSLGERRWFHLRRVNRLLTIMEQAA
jgi:transposase-like protein